jgi:hypothetical protein
VIPEGLCCSHADQGLTGTPLERVEVEVPAPESSAVGVEFGDPGGVHEDPPSLAGGDEAHHPRGLSDPARSDHHVGNLADLGPTGVEQGQAHDPECVDDLPRHGRKAISGAPAAGREVRASERVVGSPRRGCEALSEAYVQVMDCWHDIRVGRV